MSEQEKIQNWINEFLKADKLYSDIHIDRIAGKKIDEANWISTGFDYLAAAEEMVQILNNNFQIYLSISLIAEEYSLGVNFKNLKELKEQLDFSPPSLYIFRDGMTPYNGLNSDQYKKIKLDHMMDYDVFYMEYKQPDDVEYRRSIWFAKHN